MKLISLFSGAMGLDLGLEQAGFETVAGVEIDDDACTTIALNRPGLPVLNKSIVDVTGRELRQAAHLKDSEEIALVAGGPPCQSFSVFGNRDGIQDSRGQLVFEFIRVVSELQPHAFVMENVRGLLSMPIVSKRHFKAGEMDPQVISKGSLLKLIFKKFNEIGYRVDCFVVNAVNYGAPQLRERLILIGNRHGLSAEFPPPQFSNRPEDGLPPFRTLGDAIGEGFVDPDPDLMDFSPRKLKYLSMVPPGGNWRSLPIEVQKESMGKTWHLKGGRSAYWRKLSFDFPSPTVVTMPNHAGTSMCHPTELRAITVGEAAAIQEFPPDWKFYGNATSKFRQVGNAVPIRLGRVAGEVVASMLRCIRDGRAPDPSLPQSRVVHLRPHVRTRTYYKDGQAFAGNHSYYDRPDNEPQGQPVLFEDVEDDFVDDEAVAGD